MIATPSIFGRVATRFTRRPRLTLAGTVLLFALAILAGAGADRPDCASASHSPLHDFCYRTTITVANATSPPSALTGHGVRVEMDALGLINAEQLGARAHDLRPTTTGLVEIEVDAQDMDSTAAPWWVRVPSIGFGSTVSYHFYTANEEAKRNQGIFFTGFDDVTVPSHGDFDLTDNLAVVVQLQMSDATGQDSTILSRWAANDGYRLMLVDNAGSLLVQAEIDGQTTAASWATPTTAAIWRMEFEAPTLNLYQDGGLVSTSNTGLGSVTNAAADLVMGEDMVTGTLRHASVRANTATTETIVAQWGFTPHQMTELTAVDPVYTGTVADEIGSPPGATAATFDPGTHPGTYTFNRPQAGITVAVGATVLTSAPAVVALGGNLADVVGDPLASVALFTIGSENVNLPGYSILNDAANSVPLPRVTFWLGLTLFIGFLVFLAVTKWTGKVLYGILASVAPPFLAVTSSLIPAWMLVVWILILTGIFSATRWERQT